MNAEESLPCWSIHLLSTHPPHFVQMDQAPERPVEFPTPSTRQANSVTVSALDISGQVRQVHALTHCLNGQRASPLDRSDKAYVFGKKIGPRSAHFSMRMCRVLQRRNHDLNKPAEEALWRSTNEMVTMKIVPLESKYARRFRSREVPCLQLLKGGRRVQSCHEVLQDNDNMYLIMSYHSRKTLLSRVVNQCTVNEEQARTWCRQLLEMLTHLQNRGVCHGQISLQNILVDENDNLLLTNFSRALRIPYLDHANFGCVSDVTDGTIRCPMSSKRIRHDDVSFTAPEALSQNSFDGHAVDLWSAGIILFVLLTGLAPFEKAHKSDYRFRLVNEGKLDEVLCALHVRISSNATHLLQNMLWKDPQRRLSLHAVVAHPWVQAEEEEERCEDRQQQWSMPSKLPLRKRPRSRLFCRRRLISLH